MWTADHGGDRLTKKVRGDGSRREENSDFGENSFTHTHTHTRARARARKHVPVRSSILVLKESRTTII